MKNLPNEHLAPATAGHLSKESKWLTACLTIFGALALPLFVLYYALGKYWALVLAGAGGLYFAGPTIHTLRSIVVKSATVAVQRPLWI